MTSKCMMINCDCIQRLESVRKIDVAYDFEDT